MSQWVIRVQNHPVWEVLKSINSSIDLALQRDQILPETLDSIDRLRVVINFAEQRLSAIDPVLLVPVTLDNLNSLLGQLLVNINAFIPAGDVNHLNTANTYADNILGVLNSIVSIINSDDLTALSAAASTYRSTLESNLKNYLVAQKKLTENLGLIETKILGVDASLTTEQQRIATLLTEQQSQLKQKYVENEAKIFAIETALTTEQQRLGALYSDQQSQFSANQDKRASDFAASQADFLAKYTLAATDQQTQFSTDQDSRRTAFSELQRGNQQKLEALMDEYDQKLKDHNTEFLDREKQMADVYGANVEALKVEYQSNANEILLELKRHKSEVESLVGVIGNLGVTSGYKKIADHARRMLYLWQGITVTALAGLVFLAFFIAFPKEKNINSTVTTALSQNVLSSAEAQEDLKPSPRKGSESLQGEQKSAPNPSFTSSSDTDFYHGLATRIFLSLTVGIFAAYAGRQASHFFSIEQKNRKRALELEALGPFIEPLDKGDRDKFRVQIGDRSFGVPDQESNKSKDDDPVNLLTLLKSKEIQEAFATFASNIKDALKGGK
ncbi:MAG: hypothetical protein HHJ12_15195 [Glaciimonas sp.]|nr:hypothetical protein [Glaciimonas sp.]